MSEIPFNPEAIKEEKKDFEVFRKYYDEGEISKISAEEIPDDTLKFFIRYGNRFPPFDTNADDFSFLRVDQNNGDVTYIAKHTKTWRNSGDTEEMSYIFDTRDGEHIGRGEIRYSLSNHDEYFQAKPFIGFIKTEYDYRRQHLGERRIRLMNALCREQYGRPLYSDTLNSESMVGLWEKLAQKGKAVKFKEGPHDRYYYNDDESSINRAH